MYVLIDWCVLCTLDKSFENGVGKSVENVIDTIEGAVKVIIVQCNGITLTTKYS